MNLPIFKSQQTSSLQLFIDSWSKLYTSPYEDSYIVNISKRIFTEDDIQSLYVWKNGMKLSKLKQVSLDTKIKAKLSTINNFKSEDSIDLDVFKIEFKNISAVWKIFLLHIIKPNKYPIYDQHTHRSFLFIHDEDYSKLTSDSISNKNKEVFYFDKYWPFIEESQIQNLKKLDEAFFAFGQFLNTRNYKNLLE